MVSIFTTDKLHPAVVEITLNGGWHLSRPQRAVISFLCDESITEPSVPVPKLFGHDLSSPSPPLPLDEMLDSRQTDSHGFTWNTKHACPIAQDKILSDPSRTAETPSESSHTGKGNQGDEGNVSPEVPLANGDGTRPVNLVKAAGIMIASLWVDIPSFLVILFLFHQTLMKFLSEWRLLSVMRYTSLRSIDANNVTCLFRRETRRKQGFRPLVSLFLLSLLYVSLSHRFSTPSGGHYILLFSARVLETFMTLSLRKSMRYRTRTGTWPL